MRQCAASFAFAFVSQSQVVMRVSVAWRKEDCAAISLDGLFRAFQFIQNVAQVEEGKNVRRIGLGGAAIQVLGASVVLLVIVERAKVDERSCIGSIHGEYLAVDLHRGLFAALLFSLHSAQKEALQLGIATADNT